MHYIIHIGTHTHTRAFTTYLNGQGLARVRNIDHRWFVLFSFKPIRIDVPKSRGRKTRKTRNYVILYYHPVFWIAFLHRPVFWTRAGFYGLFWIRPRKNGLSIIIISLPSPHPRPPINRKTRWGSGVRELTIWASNMPNSKIICNIMYIITTIREVFNSIHRKHYVCIIYSLTVTNSSLAIRLVDRAGASVRFLVGCLVVDDVSQWTMEWG